jgi:hypothetical protein
VLGFADRPAALISVISAATVRGAASSSGNCSKRADTLHVVKGACRRSRCPTSEAAGNPVLICDCCVSDIHVASLSCCTAVAEKKNLRISRWGVGGTQASELLYGGKTGYASVRQGREHGLWALQIRDLDSLFGWLPKLDLIAIWIPNPRKVPVGIFRGLFDCHAIALKLAEHL